MDNAPHSPEKRLRHAIENADVEQAGAILSRGQSGDVSFEGLPAIFLAAQNGKVEMIDLLVEFGARPNCRATGDIGGGVALRTPLNAAASRENLDCLERLLQLGADPRQLSDNLRTTGHNLVISLHPKAEDSHLKNALALLGKMVDLGLPINQRDQMHNTILHFAVSSELPAYFIKGLVDLEADPYVLNRADESPLHLACQAQKPGALEVFVRHDVDLNYRNIAGQTALHIANHYPLIETLLQFPVDLEQQDIHGRTVLGACLHRWNTGDPYNPDAQDLSVKLILAGADLDRPDFSGRTPRQIIERLDNVELRRTTAVRDARAAMERVSTKARSARLPHPG